jgi:acyl-CoA thioester hydrolase
VREFHGPDALIECTMVDSGGRNASRCVSDRCPRRQENGSRDGLASTDVMALFFEKEAS